jgi:hypothetical protein
MDYCTSQVKINFARGWINSFVLRHSQERIQTKSAPHEEQRVQVPSAFLKRTVQGLNDNGQGCVAELVFNLDEVGISDWEDRETEKVIGPPRCLAR